MEKKRDLALDYLRGLGCVCIVVGHSTVIINSPILEIIQGVAFYGSVLFLSVSGQLASMQAQKDRLPGIIAFYGLLFFLGFAYNAIVPVYYFISTDLPPEGINFYRKIASEIIQAIAIGCIAVAAFSRLIKGRTVLYLVASIACFAISKILVLLPEFPLKSFIIAPGVFSIFPWIGFLFAGAFFYRSRVPVGLVVGGIFLAAYLVAVIFFKQDLHWKGRFEMSYGFYLMGMAGLSVLYAIFRSIGDRLPEGNNPAIFFGRNSLLFLFINIILSFYFLKFGLVFWFIAWPGIFVVTYFLMRVLLKLNGMISRPLDSLIPWFVMIVVIWLLPLLFSFNIKIIIHLEFAIGVIIALRYRDLSMRIKNHYGSLAEEGGSMVRG